MVKNKTFWVVLLGIALIVGIAFFWYQHLPALSARSFTGKITHIEGSKISVKGNFDLVSKDNDPILDNDQKEITANLNNKTKFVRTTVFLPTAQETAGTGGLFQMKDLKKETVTISYDEFKSDMTLNATDLTVWGSQNVLNKAVFDASEVDYSVIKSPNL